MSRETENMATRQLLTESVMKTVKLNSGTDMPVVGLGTFKIRGMDVVQSTVKAALQSGYRSFDTASVYRNEATLGQCLQDLLPALGLLRQDIFITSKLGPKDQGVESSRQACCKSLRDLQVDYLDLYLIHWPGSQGVKPEDPCNVQRRRDSWLSLEQLYKEGKVKAIGVSNYTVRHMKELLQECSVKPAVLQIECHPHLVQHELTELCRHHHIHCQAYSSLGTTTEQNKLLHDPVVVQLAAKYGKSAAQVLLRWAVQQGIGVLPKSTNTQHMRENIDVFNFELCEEDVATMNNLHKGVHYCWNPDKVC